ncbi:homolog to citrate lyase beta subunit [Natrialba magadii ATCC 43099]|uniref:Citrate (Pro-3S)-lyase n=1 Tax=Natrialba magadii (strain ATCC 43099 / DSM 3394 / CCM 3739 / CIP 104546 / IAM 13178 / JCM 8861 / NBRC 102185 / NCIMB 2190 / MS3) TaxID=547559 RepID=D3SX04_NATMM|nr:CoA ester lyase [Natrialba magadii]ADD05886.2 homolog to citrate lyase beta subunit [Natrialba magadii ATCC 43099]ELY30606.1 citrate (pro-3S)-lyase [Natrialba magadii ATCC 43099]
MVRRSILFTPGDQPEMLRKAPDAGADTIVFDLEDAVAPTEKESARETVRAVLTDPAFDPECEVCVRVNAPVDELTADLEAIVGDLDTDIDTATDADTATDTDTATDADTATDTDTATDADTATDTDTATDADTDTHTGTGTDTATAADTATDTHSGTDTTNPPTDLRLDSVMLPKADSADDIRTLAAELESHGLDLPILALIENAQGVLEAPGIAAVPETAALLFGAEDLSADLGATRTDEGTEVLYARERVVVAAAAHDCQAIDTVFTDFGDEDGLIEETEFAIQLGYDGKLAIHPAQVEPINEAFTPTAEALEWATAVLEAKQEADAEGRGVFEVDGEMIDAPLIAQAERIRERADAADS